MRPIILGRYYPVLAFTATIWSVCVGSPDSSLEHASSVLDVLRNWISNNQTINSSESVSIVDDDTSVCIILRHHGKVLGVGTATCMEDNPIAFAAKIAFKEMRQNATLRNIQPEFRSYAYKSISIELELGDTPIPYPSKNLDRFTSTLNQGIDGVAVRKGVRWAIRLPSELRLSPLRNMITVLESLSITVGVHPAVALSRQLPKQDDVTLYTIPTITIIQDREGEKPRRLIRGDELVSVASVEQFGLLGIADLLASHLIICTSKSGSSIGGYQPETDKLSPPIASLAVQAMIATSLEEYALVEGACKADEARLSATSIFESIAMSVDVDTVISEEVAAMVVITLAPNHADRSERIMNLYARCRQRIIEVALAISARESESRKPHIFSMLVAAITAIAIVDGDADLRTLAKSTCNICLEQVPLESRVSTIPWLTDAILDLRESGSDISVTPVIELLDVALSSQVKDGVDEDLLGGFALITPRGKIVDVRGIRMIPMMARLGRTPQLQTSRSSILRSLILATRFVTQLTTREQRSQRFQNPTIALGGVRAATWDASMPTEATAMALIGVSRTIEAFRVAAQLH